MKSIKIFATLLFMCLTITVWANTNQDAITTFQQLYPNANDVNWAKKGTYQIACFTENGLKMNAWFTKDGVWKMTETDVLTLNLLPKAVAKAFWQSTNSALAIGYIRIITLPNNQPKVYVIDVQAWNSPEEFQLFYGPDGKLIQTLNATQTGGELYPDLFS